MCAGPIMNVPVCCLLFRPVLLGRAPREWITDDILHGLTVPRPATRNEAPIMPGLVPKRAERLKYTRMSCYFYFELSSSSSSGGHDSWSMRSTVLNLCAFRPGIGCGCGRLGAPGILE
eukprot:scaffold5135_cov113-Isochrysis_galbana.AAC.9